MHDGCGAVGGGDDFSSYDGARSLWLGFGVDLRPGDPTGKGVFEYTTSLSLDVGDPDLPCTPYHVYRTTDHRWLSESGQWATAVGFTGPIVTASCAWDTGMFFVAVDDVVMLGDDGEFVLSHWRSGGWLASCADAGLWEDDAYRADTAGTGDTAP